MGNKFIILDRDETLNHDPGYINNTTDFKFKEETIPALSLLARFGYRFVIATNQAGIAKNKIKTNELHPVHEYMLDMLREQNIHIEKIYVCPHKDEDLCNCRKPKSGMIDSILSDFQLKPENCWLIGDRYRDIFPGEKNKIPGILVYNSENSGPAPLNLVFTATHLKEAADYILETQFEKELANKIFLSKDHKAFLSQISEYKKNKRRIVFTNGCFDILHTGHLQYLKMAKELGDVLVIGVNSDESVRALKGPARPVNNQLDRQRALAALSFTDAAVVFTENTPVELISVIKPDIHVKGGDYNADNLPETKVVRENGGEVVILPFRKGYSTTSTIERINRK